jgi:hypothetical protein
VPLTGPGPRRRQLSLFSVEAADPSPADLAGLLAGPGRVSRMGGTARVTVTVDAAWRVHVLVAELALRGLEVSWHPLPAPAPAPAPEPTSEPTPEPAAPDPRPAGPQLPGGFEVRTAYSSLLAPLAAAWTAGGVPRFFHLDGRRLRLWVAAGGRPDGAGFTLLMPAEPAREAVAAALARAGLAARTVADPPGYRIAGRRRLARLAELVGDRPAAAPAECWPAVPG